MDTCWRVSTAMSVLAPSGKTGTKKHTLTKQNICSSTRNGTVFWRPSGWWSIESLGMNLHSLSSTGQQTRNARFSDSPSKETGRKGENTASAPDKKCIKRTNHRPLLETIGCHRRLPSLSLFFPFFDGLSPRQAFFFPIFLILFFTYSFELIDIGKYTPFNVCVCNWIWLFKELGEKNMGGD